MVLLRKTHAAIVFRACHRGAPSFFSAPKCFSSELSSKSHRKIFKKSPKKQFVYVYLLLQIIGGGPLPPTPLLPPLLSYSIIPTPPPFYDQLLLLLSVVSIRNTREMGIRLHVHKCAPTKSSIPLVSGSNRIQNVRGAERNASPTKN